MFDTRAAAEAAAERLRAAGFGAGTSILDKSATGFDANEYSTREKPGIWASIKNAFLPDEDRHIYEEGVRRGGAVVSVDAGHEEVPDVVAILESHDSVDVHQRSQTWRDEGWNRSPGAAASAAAATGVDMGGGGGSKDRLPDERSPDYDLDGTPDFGHSEGMDPKRTPNPSYGQREHDSGRARSYFGGGYATEPDYAHGGRQGTSAAGLANEASGNVKQGVAGLTGSEGLRREGEAQERHGEAQQGRRD
jgi:uncharacterized protein YjbJ (UPF0337 family)